MQPAMKLAHVAFETTSECNLRCRYCYNIWKRPGGQPAFQSSYSNAIKVLKRLFRLARVDSLAMTGGEPFLSERFAEVVLLCRMKGARVSIISNGSASKEDLRTMVDLGVGLFEFPLHDTRAEVHDWMTRTPGSHRRALQCIQDARSLDVAVVPVIVLTRANLSGLGKTLLFLKELGTQRIMLNRFNIGGQGILEGRDLTPSLEELRGAFRLANEMALKNNLRLSSNVCTPRCVLNPTDYPFVRFGACSEDPSRLPLTLDPQGDLRLCNHSPIKIGNIFRSDLGEMFSTRYVQQWKTKTPDFCSPCRERQVCRGGCRAAAEQTGASAEPLDPLVAELGVSPLC